MEVFLAALMVLGIFVVAPALIGFIIVGAFVLRERMQTARALKHEAADAATALETKVEAVAERKLAEEERELAAGGQKKAK